ncbi:MAG: hypothetical protein UU73_C0003G0024 [Candidatus Daviesbacteria bacterium GW2011_GWA1_41_61]|uniref:O-antigen ligase-related domain-containing protein n=1 Tax=Candidatus Daviesbacteria bacterium GW2011_GWA2_40_9 TaxID=1618424 RepID=A0A0G0TZ71_9BACT|nr:MAG: hypothetical protein UU26_C0005G0032 [Candidatus Daviesbacteria bacterium GW2011_GWC1_40_9]KKR82184.1 MAG: hypothetical protein UU29_C0017G0020 [Candidatus Daviesbacteria bacterium GW2011_GWA2_40_9]KKR93624.1 MAG: hypothetical protein UU44_C0002G0285 [Candidatus Daviesbacteria bacterium GW2011_GWB1_41_15]KKS14825.1 MAG: hypothetical protein UU73_C0003G0024 [Candidatus Daviesbacteria bacterium GW2011_GWA1_41_61]
MIFVYFLTLVITTAWIIRIIQNKQLILKRTPLDIPILFFLGANILSTIFSIDPHTSWWGYYTRSNGGLISIISYTLLYYALVSNFKTQEGIKFLKAAVVGGLIVALYAIPEHFGVSPSCIFLTGNFDAACWIQNVQARVFATLGQTNWLAAYLAMLIFPAIYFVLKAPDKLTAIRYLLYAVIIYMAFTFTYSRGGTLGFLGGLSVFIFFQIPIFKDNLTKIIHSLFKKVPVNQLSPKTSAKNAKLFGAILVSLFLINLIFGSTLTRFKLFLDSSQPTTFLASLGSQLEAGGSESGQIRLVVWKGAIEIFKHYPIFGSGVETFAYSYYNFRPMEHNYLSEWDFLYNKAHNEFVNYLATTGIVGFGTYMFLILAFIFWSIKYYVLSSKQKTLDTNHILLITSLLASYISYHIQNFFGFSVVIIAVFFYLFPALAFLISENTKPLSLPRLNKIAGWTLYRRSLYSKALQVLVLLVSSMILVNLLKYYLADIAYAKGGKANDQGEVGKAYNFLSEAAGLNPREPQYRSDLGYAAAAAAVALENKDATLSAELKKEAITETERILAESPRNVSFYRAAIRTYYLLSDLDEKYIPKTLELMDKTAAMAPTDPKLPYHKSVILDDLGKQYEAVELLNKTLQMKPDYRDARITLAKLYSRQGKKDQAIAQLEIILKINPQDQEVLEALEQWKGK